MKFDRNISLFCVIPILLGHCSNELVPIPACTVNTFPYHGSYVTENSVINFSWTESPTATGYDVFVGHGSDSAWLVASDVTETAYAYTVPSGMSTVYHWYVRPKNAGGAATGCESKATTFVTSALPSIDKEQKIVNVLVLNYDPKITSSQLTHQYFNWNDPRSLAQQYSNDVAASSGDLIKFNITEWRDIEAFPMKADGFTYTSSEYFTCIQNHETCHAADGVDYLKIIEDQDIVKGINDGAYDEVWIFGGPYFGFYESCMAGPKAFEINGAIFPSVKTTKAFAIMGFNYERGPGEMIHNLCHRTEATMSRVYGGWQAESLTTSWARFAANITQSGTAAVGTCHYPPNASSDYDYGNKRTVQSTADDWLNYPVLTGATKELNCDTWGGPEHERNYLKWWFSHLPKRTGKAHDGTLNCWWRYIFEFNETILK